MPIRACATALLLALLGLPGCFVAEELDAGEKLLEQHGGAGGHRQPEPAAAQAEEKGPSVQERARSWWQQARSIHPAERSAGIVRCKVGDGIHFTRSEDCLARGGRPLQ